MSRRVKRFLEEGVVLDMKQLQANIRDLVGDYTFQEAVYMNHII